MIAHASRCVDSSVGLTALQLYAIKVDEYDQANVSHVTA